MNNEKNIMISKNKIKNRLISFFIRATRSLLRAALLLLLCSNPLAAQNAPDTVTIKLPDGPEMRFKAVHLGISGKNFFASKKITLGSREGSQSYKERQVDTMLSGSFIGKRDGKSDWLYYLGETEVSQGQWNSIMRWMNRQKGRSLSAEGSDNPLLPQTGATVAEIYRFIEGVNTWMLQEQSSRLPKLYNAKAFCRLPTEAEWAFAARGGIEVNQNVFDRPHPYGEDVGKYEWHKGNSSGTMRECGSIESANPVGLKDMLGNVEELTVSLFSPEYQQGRFGQFAIRGNNYSDFSGDFNVAHRTEFASHDQQGKLRHPSKVGFRLALSTSIASTGKLGRELDREFDKYVGTLALPKPGLTGHSSPAQQAEESMIHSLEKQIEQREEETRRLANKLDELETLRRNDQQQCSATEHKNNDLARRNDELWQEISKLQSILATSPTQAEMKTLQQKLAGLRKKYQTINEQLRNVSAKEKPEKVLISDNTQELRRQLQLKEETLKKKELEVKEKNQEMADLKRHQELTRNEGIRNAVRVREVEKRYLEALMRQASANAYNAWVQLIKRKEIYRPRGEKEKAQQAYFQACQLLHDYWHLVQKIAQETQVGLFPEVQQEVSDWLRKGEQENIFSEECRRDNGQQLLSDIQRKSLDLLQRHVKQVRTGRSRLPDNLIETFIEQPEFR